MSNDDNERKAHAALMLLLLTSSPEDIEHFFRTIGTGTVGDRREELNDDERRFIDYISKSFLLGNFQITTPQLCAALGWTESKVKLIALELERRGCVRYTVAPRNQS